LKSADHVNASAVVLEGTSFRAAFVRSIVTGLTMLAHQPFPHQVCSMEEAERVFELAADGTRIPFVAAGFQSGIANLRAMIEDELIDPGSAKVGGAA
jgi:hypothetical protein